MVLRGDIWGQRSPHLLILLAMCAYMSNAHMTGDQRSHKIGHQHYIRREFEEVSRRRSPSVASKIGQLEASVTSLEAERDKLIKEHEALVQQQQANVNANKEITTDPYRGRSRTVVVSSKAVDASMGSDAAPPLQNAPVEPIVAPGTTNTDRNIPSARRAPPPASASASNELAQTPALAPMPQAMAAPVNQANHNQQDEFQEDKLPLEEQDHQLEARAEKERQHELRLKSQKHETDLVAVPEKDPGTQLTRPEQQTPLSLRLEPPALQGQHVSADTRDAILGLPATSEMIAANTSFAPCKDSREWPDVIKGVTCGPCRAYVATARHGFTCEGYCKSFGHTCVFAEEDQSKVGIGCGVEYNASCNSGKHLDMLCTCHHPTSELVQRLADLQAARSASSKPATDSQLAPATPSDTAQPGAELAPSAISQAAPTPPSDPVQPELWAGQSATSKPASEGATQPPTDVTSSATSNPSPTRSDAAQPRAEMASSASSKPVPTPPSEAAQPKVEVARSATSKPASTPSSDGVKPQASGDPSAASKLAQSTPKDVVQSKADVAPSASSKSAPTTPGDATTSKVTPTQTIDAAPQAAEVARSAASNAPSTPSQGDEGTDWKERALQAEARLKELEGKQLDSKVGKTTGDQMAPKANETLTEAPAQNQTEERTMENANDEFFQSRAQFVMGTASSNSCPSGAERIDEATACEAAAKHFEGKFLGAHESPEHPKGCWQENFKTNVWFNKHGEGKSNIQSVVICKNSVLQKDQNKAAQGNAAHASGARAKPSPVTKVSANSIATTATPKTAIKVLGKKQTQSSADQSAQARALQGLKFVKGSTSTNDCPTGSEKIDLVAACEQAAKKFSLKYGGSATHADYPKGCYQEEGQPDVWFNDHSAGNANFESRVICKETQPESKASAATPTLATNVLSAQQTQATTNKNTQEHAVQGEAYIKGNIKTNDCPKGSNKIAQAGACEEAAKKFGLKYGGRETQADYPKGCYQEEGQPDVWFNDHSAGNANFESRVICKNDQSIAAAATPPPVTKVLVTQQTKPSARATVQAQAAQGATFIKGGTSSNDCPKGSDRIDLAAACEQAAKKFGLKYGGRETQANYPKGCYQEEGQPDVWFNDHSTGKADFESRILCKQNSTNAANQGTTQQANAAATQKTQASGDKSASTFIKGGIKTNDCPKGSEKIDEMAACEQAAKNLALKYSGRETKSEYPKGCYQEEGNPDVWFNDHPVGNANSESRVICKTIQQGGPGQSIATLATPRPAMKVLVTFLLGEVQSNECASGTEKLDRSDGCEEAAKNLGLKYSGRETQADYPKGCYREEGQPDVWFNDHSNGKPNFESRVICKKSSLAALNQPIATLATSKVVQPPIANPATPRPAMNDKAVEFLKGSVSANICPSGSEKIDKAQDCELAAKHFGLKYGGGEKEANYPKGCYQEEGQPDVWFNDHPTGDANFESRVICKGSEFRVLTTLANSLGAAPAPTVPAAPIPSPPATAASQLAAAAITVQKQEKPKQSPSSTPTSTQFLIGGVSTNVCPTGYKKITDAKACDKAAAEHKLFYSGVETLPDYPAGCYREDGQPDVWFNSHPEGKANFESRVVCQKS